MWKSESVARSTGKVAGTLGFLGIVYLQVHQPAISPENMGISGVRLTDCHTKTTGDMAIMSCQNTALPGGTVDVIASSNQFSNGGGLGQLEDIADAHRNLLLTMSALGIGLRLNYVARAALEARRTAGVTQSPSVTSTAAPYDTVYIADIGLVPLLPQTYDQFMDPN